MWQELHPSAMRRKTSTMLRIKRTCVIRERLPKKTGSTLKRKAFVMKDGRAVRTEAEITVAEEFMEIEKIQTIITPATVTAEKTTVTGLIFR